MLARLNLALTLRARGDLRQAREIEEQVLAARARILPDDHPELEKARVGLASTLACLGEREKCIELATELAVSLRTSIRDLAPSLSPRAMEDRGEGLRMHTACVLSIAGGYGLFDASPSLAAQAFALAEMIRESGLLSARLLAANSGFEASLLRERARVASERLVRVAQSGADRDAIASAREDRDHALRELLQSIAGEPRAQELLVEPSVAALTRVIGSDEALIGYWSYTRWRRVPNHPSQTLEDAVESLLAFVVRKNDGMQCVDLGPLEPIEEAIRDWRRTLQGSFRTGAVVESAPSPPSSTASGRKLRELVFDPLRGAIGSARTLTLALDGGLHAVPLDVLPDGEHLLGESYSIRLRTCLGEIAWPSSAPSSARELVAIGGAAFDAEPEGPQGSDAGDANAPSADDATAFGAAAIVLQDTTWARGFGALPETAVEARGIAGVFASAFGAAPPPLVLEDRRASRAALETFAPTARWLHVATHGWFAPESVASTRDARPLDSLAGLGRAMSAEEQVRGSSPMLLCGLALAGANLQKDRYGRIPGTITAEEIARLDLSNCELAVLSACDTNVGVERAGQGVASLQKALHMAGARSVLTSLWKVRDTATKELMLDFYRRIWIDKEPKARALWEAKMSLRARRAPLRDWGGWVLSGDSD